MAEPGMNTLSDLGQRAHVAAVVNMRRGDGCRWRAAFAAAVVVGRYERGATLALARDLNRSVDSVERLARAAVTYLALHRLLANVPNLPERLRKLRRELPVSHFERVGRQMQNDMPALEAFAQLDTAAEGGASAESLSSNGHIPSILAELDRLMARHVRLAERLDRAPLTRRQVEQAVEFLRTIREQAEKEGLE